MNVRSFAAIRAILGVLMTVCKLQAADPSVNWISDSYGSFEVILTGTGPGWSGTVTSPSGLWQLQTANVIGCPTPTSSLVFVDNVGDATFLGQLPSQFPAPSSSAGAPFNTASICTFGGYLDYFQSFAPINDGNSLIYGYLNELSKYGPFQDWFGMSTISITSIPNPEDPSTWTWTAKYTASGENLEAPEPSTISIMGVAALLGIARLFCKNPKLRCKASPLKRELFLQNAGFEMVFCDSRPIPWLNNQRSPQTIIWRASAPFAAVSPICRAKSRLVQKGGRQKGINKRQDGPWHTAS